MKSDRTQQDDISQLEGLKRLYGELCTEIYRDVVHQARRLEQRQEPDNGWSVTRDQTCGIDTWKKNGDKSDPRFGTNGELQVKLFTRPDSYDFVKTDDFIARGELICDAALRLVQQYSLTAQGKELAANVNLTKWIDTFREEFIANIKKNAAIDIKLIRGDDLEHFKTQHKQAKTLMRQLLSDLSGGITSLRNENDRDKVILELQEAEKQVMKERGRPVVIKAGNIGEPGMPTRMISAAFPQGSESIPSTLRDGKSDTKLSNHVLEAIGVIKGKGVSINMLLDGHSSYTPIAEKNDEWRRLYIGTLALKNKLTASAMDIKKLHPDSNLGASADNPIVISLSTMMLLTPFKPLDAFRGGESETRQVNEAHFIMQLVRHQQPQPLVLQDGATRLYVKLDQTAMNIPSNALVHTQKVREPLIQQYVNGVGFLEYMANIRENTLAKKDYLQGFLGEQVMTDLLKYCPKFPRPESTVLSDLYSQFHQLLKDHANDIPNETACKELKTQIEDTQSKLAASVKELLDPHRKNIQLHSTEMGALQTRLDEALTQKDLPEDVKDYVLLQKRFLSAELMYCTKQYLKPENAYLFQALYLLSNEQMGRLIEIFCKSGEDRTGWMRVTMLAVMAFREQQQRDPDFTKPADMALFQKFYINHSHEVSACRDITAHNSAATGLQVAESCTTDEKMIKCDTLMATLAKEVFSEGALPGTNKKMSPLPKENYGFQMVNHEFQRCAPEMSERRSSLTKRSSNKVLSEDAAHSATNSPRGSFFKKPPMEGETSSRRLSVLGSLTKAFSGRPRSNTASATLTRPEATPVAAPEMRK